MEHYFKEGDYLVFVSCGEGASEEDEGKIVRFLKDRPKGQIANDYDYDVYFECLEDETYESTNNFDGTWATYGNAGSSMFRLALQEDLERYGLSYLQSPEIVLRRVEWQIKQEIGLW